MYWFIMKLDLASEYKLGERKEEMKRDKSELGGGMRSQIEKEGGVKRRVTRQEVSEWRRRV